MNKRWSPTTTSKPAMTPCIVTLNQRAVPFQLHEYEHDAAVTAYGLEAADKLAVEPARVFKTLLVSLQDDSLVVALLPVNEKLDLKAVAKAFDSKKARMAERKQVENSTGYILGGVSPVGQKKRLPTVLDESAQQHTTIFVSAGRRGLEVELNPNDLIELICGSFRPITCRI